MAKLNKTRMILRENESDQEFVELIRIQGAFLYYQMNKNFTGENRLTFPVNPKYISCALSEFGRGYVNYDIEEDGTKTLKSYALYVTLLDCLETNIISIGGEDKYLDKIVRRSIEYARNGTLILTINILPLDSLVEYFDRFGFYKDRVYFIKEENIVTDKIRAIRLIKEF